jgi:hypothetical protein
MDQGLRGLVSIVGFTLLLGGCAKEATPAPAEPAAEVKEEKKVLPPEPTVTHTAAEAQAGQKIEHGELLLEPDENTKKLNAQHHGYKVLETRRVPGRSTKPEMKEIKDFALSKSELDVINPGPGEYVHVMEGPASRLPEPHRRDHLHRARRRAAHALAQGRGIPCPLSGQKILYALGDKIFVKEGPYIVNIPAGRAPLASRTWTTTWRSWW